MFVDREEWGMTLYIGFYTIDPHFQRESGERARSGDNTMDERFGRKVVELRDRLPASLKLLGSYATQSAERPNIWLCETDNQADLQFVSNYYEGYLRFDWVPATVIGANAAETEARRQASAANR
ncbi:MAG: hypothetical protein AB7I38_07005 [Dehalococcoidia bacterium]